ncbi:hypothetical protein NCGM1179_2680 [Pseudomonas aeruginosa NCMG1179]|nr:hypothetical protein NCGM1179_2680 [Pseudomonas aeruginosa NCMG1179]
MSNPYLELFAAPGAKGFSAAGLLARMPLSMTGLGIVTMLSQVHADYWLAGTVAATFVFCNALLAPQVSRLVDRFGQGRVLLPAALASALSMSALLLCTHYRAPNAWLYLFALLAGAMPSMPAMVRARWTELYRGSPKLHTAFSFESVDGRGVLHHRAGAGGEPQRRLVRRGGAAAGDAVPGRRGEPVQPATRHRTAAACPSAAPRRQRAGLSGGTRAGAGAGRHRGDLRRGGSGQRGLRRGARQQGCGKPGVVGICRRLMSRGIAVRAAALAPGAFPATALHGYADGPEPDAAARGGEHPCACPDRAGGRLQRGADDDPGHGPGRARGGPGAPHRRPDLGHHRAGHRHGLGLGAGRLGGGGLRRRQRFPRRGRRRLAGLAAGPGLLPGAGSGRGRRLRGVRLSREGVFAFDPGDPRAETGVPVVPAARLGVAVLRVAAPGTDRRLAVPVGDGDAETVGAADRLHAEIARLAAGQFQHALGRFGVAVVDGAAMGAEDHCVIRCRAAPWVVAALRPARLDECLRQWRQDAGQGCPLGLEQGGDEERMLFQLHRADRSVGAPGAGPQCAAGKFRGEARGDCVAAMVVRLDPVGGIRQGQARAAQQADILAGFEQSAGQGGDHRLVAVRMLLAMGRRLPAEGVAGELEDRVLEAGAGTEERPAPAPGMGDQAQHRVGVAIGAARHAPEPVIALQRRLGGQAVAGQPVECDLQAECLAGQAQGQGNRPVGGDVRVVVADQGNAQRRRGRGGHPFSLQFRHAGWRALALTL